jgi:hypothetical protein
MRDNMPQSTEPFQPTTASHSATEKISIARPDMHPPAEPFPRMPAAVNTDDQDDHHQDHNADNQIDPKIIRVARCVFTAKHKPKIIIS